MHAHAREPDRRRESPTTASPEHDADHAEPDLAATAMLEPAPLREPGTSRIRRGTAAGLPDGLRSGIESLSGLELDDVRVHRDSTRPAALGAAAYTEGADIHLGPGQEEHLAHEAWHVVQQKQGRVRPTTRLGRTDVADAGALETEADAMGARALAGPAPATAPRRRAVAAPGTVQLKWGQHDGKERDRVRGILDAVGRMNPFPYELAGVLEDLVHVDSKATDAALRTAVQHLADHLTTVERGEAIAAALGAGTTHGYVDLACRACADDTKLADLLTFAGALERAAPPQVPDVTALTVAATLLAQGRTTPQLVDLLVATPTMATTAPRAAAVVDHRLAGGSATGALLAAAVVGDDDGALPGALTAVRAFAAQAGFDALDARDQQALVAERSRLTTDDLIAKGVAVATSATRGEAAAALTRMRAFNYDPAVEAHVSSKAQAHAESVVTQARARAEADADQSKVAIRDSKRDEATTAALTRNEKRAFERNPQDAALGRKRDLKLETMVVEDDRQIDSTLTTERQRIADEVGPAAQQSKEKQYTQWLATVQHHPRAVEALRAAAEDFALAGKVIDALNQASGAGPILLAGVERTALVNLVTIPAADLAQLSAAGVTPAQAASFAASAHQARLLGILGRAGVTAARVLELAPLLGRFAAEVQDATESGHLAQLLRTVPVDVVLSLRECCPTEIPGRLGALAQVVAKTATPEDAKTVLTFCKEAHWNAALLTQTFQPLAPASLLAVVQAAVFGAELGRFQADSREFGGWLNAVDRLVRANHLDVISGGAWQGHDGRRMHTDHRDYRVVLKGTTTRVGSFCVHHHPEAVRASPGNPNASRSHLKPTMHSDEHYYTPDALTGIRPKIELRPPTASRR